MWFQTQIMVHNEDGSSWDPPTCLEEMAGEDNLVFWSRMSQLINISVLALQRSGSFPWKNTYCKKSLYICLHINTIKFKKKN